LPFTKLTDEVCQQTVDLLVAHGSQGAASRTLGISRSTFAARLQEAQRRNFQPQNQALIAGDKAAAPEGYKLKGTSTLYGANGEVKIQWIKTDAALERLRELQEAAFRALCAELKPIKPIKLLSAVNVDLLNLYTLTDCHVGMLAWQRETGEPWDLKIAEACLTDIFGRMIAAAPEAEVGIVNQLGDFLHFDSLTPETPAHRHVLDADSRYQKVVEVAVRILRRIIEMALAKHKTVQVYMHEGNHDPAGSVWLRVMFAQLYAGNPRVTVEQSPNPYVAYRHGKTFLGFHHGHLQKPGGQPLLFAAKFPELWGVTEHRYIHGGHRHHSEEKEHPGIKFIQHPTLSAPDAYASRGGWLSKRQASSMTYHKNLGEIARGIFIPNV